MEIERKQREASGRRCAIRSLSCLKHHAAPGTRRRARVEASRGGRKENGKRRLRHRGRRLPRPSSCSSAGGAHQRQGPPPSFGAPRALPRPAARDERSPGDCPAPRARPVTRLRIRPCQAPPRPLYGPPGSVGFRRGHSPPDTQKHTNIAVAADQALKLNSATHSTPQPTIRQLPLYSASPCFGLCASRHPRPRAAVRDDPADCKAANIAPAGPPANPRRFRSTHA